MKTLFAVMFLFYTGTMLGQSDTIPAKYRFTNYEKFLAEVVRYPKDAAMKGIQGRVDYVFQIDSVGCINSIEIVESPHEDLSEALIRALSKTECNWIPASIDGKPVNSSLKAQWFFKLE